MFCLYLGILALLNYLYGETRLKYPKYRQSNDSLGAQNSLYFSTYIFNWNTFNFLQTLADPLQSRRIDQAIYGKKDADIEGLLQLIDHQHTTDSCRAYQCIKTLVHAATQSSLVKDKLLEDPGKWQWAVSWLKEKMDGGGDTGSSLVSTANDAHSGFDAASNEDSLSRTFHRTTSAVVTLAEANAILAEFDSPMEEGAATAAGVGGGVGNPNEMEIDSKERLDEDEEMPPDLLEMKDWNCDFII